MRTEEEVLKAFYMLGYQVVCKGQEQFILERGIHGDSFIERISIDLKQKTYSTVNIFKTKKKVYDQTTRELHILEHKLLNELFICWGWLE